MPAGTFVIDHEATFTAAILMSAAPKDKFGEPGVQERAADGTPKWTAQVAVTFAANSGMSAPSDVLTITITAHGNPAESMTPGTMVVFDGLRVGVSTPEKTDRGGIRGGKLWYSATGLRAATAGLRGVKADAS